MSHPEFILDNFLNRTEYMEIHKRLCEKYGELSLGFYEIGVNDEETLTDVLTDDNYNLELIFDLMELLIECKVKKMERSFYEKDYILMKFKI